MAKKTKWINNDVTALKFYKKYIKIMREKIKNKNEK